ncbi:conserved hypothetical protein [Talaromyces marneffei ATCC 18224]|uniref:Xylanolytic transcriptional activator regulatory domain-containing protein n=1 Tax=Talaromyces marneffei (strain ATCC 18224 / CBS 334.59 / QM 7333) TaxID=441960 RepID=B6QAN2_TALMQ|nr:conserved hypothetical protein [Talaromyces marneffei ATCC 18224]
MANHDGAGLDEDVPDAPAISGQTLGLFAHEDVGPDDWGIDEGSNQVAPDISKEFMNDAESQAAQPSTSQTSAPAKSTHTNIATSPGEPQLDLSVLQRVALNEVLAVLDEFTKASSLQDWSIGSRDDAGNDKNPNESKTLPYKIILNFQAAMLLDRQEELPDEIQEHIEPIKRRKFFDVLSKVDKITFRTPPSLHMLRAQCMGVVILQSFGNVPEAWSMIAASRTFVALGCDTFQKDSLSSTNNKTWADPDEDREACIAWCYQLDRSMSLLLRRPPLLPKSSTPPRLAFSPLDDKISWKLHFIHLSLDLTHIQGLISFVTRDAGLKPQWKDLEPLHNELKDLWERLDTWESESPGSVWDLFVRDIDYLRFRGYATQTILLQLSTDIAKSRLLQKAAVDCARKCFESFLDLTRDGHKIEMIDLSWDLLLYSLSPLCVLAYNIVRTRGAGDLKLLEDFAGFIFTRIIKKSPDNNPLATPICNLYRSITNICRPLISAAPSTTAGQSSYLTNHTPHRKNFMNFEHFFGGDASATGSSSSNPTGTSSATTPNQSQNRNRNSTNAAAEGNGARIDDGIEYASVTEEQFMKLLMCRVSIGWSD